MGTHAAALPWLAAPSAPVVRLRGCAQAHVLLTQQAERVVHGPINEFPGHGPPPLSVRARRTTESCAPVPLCRAPGAPTVQVNLIVAVLERSARGRGESLRVAPAQLQHDRLLLLGKPQEPAQGKDRGVVQRWPS